jgi:hypothetical protein
MLSACRARDGEMDAKRERSLVCCILYACMRKEGKEKHDKKERRKHEHSRNLQMHRTKQKNTYKPVQQHTHPPTFP